jgi:hypothetical protein
MPYVPALPMKVRRWSRAPPGTSAGSSADASAARALNTWPLIYPLTFQAIARPAISLKRIPLPPYSSASALPL